MSRGLDENVGALNGRHPVPGGTMNQSSVLAQFGRFDDALDCYDGVLQRRPDFAEGWFYKGCILLEAGRPKAAVPCFEKAIELSASFERARELLTQAKAAGAE